MTIRRICLGLLCLAVLIGGWSCSRTMVPDGVDLAELERVWQTCEVYSLYAHRLPEEKDLVSVGTPENIIALLGDTLHIRADTSCYQVGEYFAEQSDLASWLSASASVATGKSNSESVYIDTVIDAQTVSVRINTFMDSELFVKFQALIPELRKYRNIIVNIAGNLGGYVDVSRLIVDEFVPAGTPYLRTRQRNGAATSFADTGTITELWTDTTGFSALEGKKVAIIVDGGSASASEILAASLRDALGDTGCVLIGDTTLGKDIGQNIIVFSRGAGAGLKLTSMQFTRIDTRYNQGSYHERGIAPDIHVADYAACITSAKAWFANPAAAAPALARARSSAPSFPKPSLPADYGRAILSVDTLD